MLSWSQERPVALESAPGLFVLVGEMGKTNDKLPQAVLEAALKKAIELVSGKEALTKTTMDGIVQLIRLYKECGGDEEGIPKKLRVIWLDEMKAKGQED